METEPNMTATAAHTAEITATRSMPRRSARLRAERVTLRYGERVISESVDLDVLDGELTVIVGPNGCGKSTLLAALARLLPPAYGNVLLDGAPIGSQSSKHVARQLGLLPQSSIAPDGITVADLVSRGRFPHQGLLRQWTPADSAAVEHALGATNTAVFARRPVAELSGGERQRVWLAMILAQDTPILMLDEPTTFLDIAHQIDVLDLIAELHESGRTVVVVLHDLNLACRYATHLVAMRDGRIAAQGAPSDIVDAELVERAFGLACRVIADPETGTPLVVPAARRR
jgi:iron complex transport system ATP-binding protein